jgi:hypothetical protein
MPFSCCKAGRAGSDVLQAVQVDAAGARLAPKLLLALASEQQRFSTTHNAQSDTTGVVGVVQLVHVSLF